MKHYIFITLVSVVFLFSFLNCKSDDQELTDSTAPSTQISTTDAQENNAGNDASGTVLQDSDDRKIRIGKSVISGNITFYPLIHENPPKAKEYISLEEGLNNESVIVKEIVSNNSSNNNSPERGYNSSLGLGGNFGGGNSIGNNESSAGSVNAVEIMNNSNKNLYILSGEIIIGGKQDRAVTVDVVIESKDKKIVEVCCVEQGRWSVRQSNEGYEFKKVAAAGLTSKMKVKTLEDGKGAQHKVWEGVSICNEEIKNSDKSDTYHKYIEHHAALIDKHKKMLIKGLGENKNVCGLIVCINGNIFGIELFATPSIYKLFEERLTNGYILDAISEEKEWDSKGEVTQKQLKAYFDDFLENQRKSTSEGNLKFYSDVQKGFNSSLGLGGNLGGEGVTVPLHSNSYSKSKSGKNK